MSSKESLGNSVRREGSGQRALRIWGRCYIRLVLCGLRAITDGEMVGAGNSTISISADAYGGIWLASGGGDRGIHGWIG